MDNKIEIEKLIYAFTGKSIEEYSKEIVDEYNSSSLECDERRDTQ